MAEVTIEGQKVVFPSICPVCQMPATKPYLYRKRMTVPGLHQWVQFPIGYCNQHADQLIQSDIRLNRITLVAYLLGILAWAGAALVAIRLFPELKIIPGDSLVVWIVSTITVMCSGVIVLALSGVGLLVPFAVFALPSLVRWVFEGGEAKKTRSALTIKSFDLPPALVGSSKLKRITLGVVEIKYAHMLHELNQGSKLEGA